MIEIIRTVGNYSLCKKGRKYFIDNGIDDVSEYMDKFDCADLFDCKDHEFINKCLNYFVD